MTSFHDSDTTTPPNNFSQALWFGAQTDSFATTSLWNERYSYNTGSWSAYPTITMDPDLELSLTNTFFIPNEDIFPNWYSGKWFAQPSIANPAYPLFASGQLAAATSSGAYTGDSSPPDQRWGDYTAMMLDPSESSPDNEHDLFWTAQELTTGGSNQSSEIIGLQDPLPFFAGSTLPIGVSDGGIGESDCGNTPLTCSMTFSAPPGAQFGDVFAVGMWVGEKGHDRRRLQRTSRLDSATAGQPFQSGLPDFDGWRLRFNLFYRRIRLWQPAERHRPIHSEYNAA